MASQLAADVPICRYRGDTRTMVFHITSSAGADVDITGRTYLLTVDSREEPDDVSTQLFQLTGVIPVGTDGRVEFTMSTGEADNLGEFYYDVQETSGGQPLTKVKSTWTFLQDITK